MIYETFDSENTHSTQSFFWSLSLACPSLRTPLENLWTFSIYLESAAILPQLFILSKAGESETITSCYLVLLGRYLALYLASWIGWYQTENLYG